MIAYLEGEIISQSQDYIILLVSGVGYKVHLTRIPDSSPARIYVYHHVASDNQPSLYGLGSEEELQMFEKLIKVSGVGPKIAQKIIESDSIDNLAKAINEGDVKFFTKVKGLGKKNAQKIILELKNKLVEMDSGTDSFTYDALQSLGFSKIEIDRTLKNLNTNDLNDEQIIELVLKNIK